MPIDAHDLVTKWRTGGTLLRRIPLGPHHTADTSLPPLMNTTSAVPTSLALDTDWLVIGLANSRIHIFSARTGVSCRTLVGHGAGVWAVALVRPGGERVDPPAAEVYERIQDMDIAGASMSGSGKHRRQKSDRTEEVLPKSEQLSQAMRVALGLEPLPGHTVPPLNNMPRMKSKKTRPVQPNGIGRPSEPSGTSDGWGQPNALVVSGGCDKDLRVWDVKSGYVG
jgi:F-box and WD-40 domain protein CDC4